ncbi:lysozyme C, milk isozyme-like [Anolis carolinensis]|uniref:Glycosyl hydrolases family 22 (GH22) domain-containing protein n=1 Tax=Anolis carolinensis TaxID=28377 RepID=G1KF47_ANOCA
MRMLAVVALLNLVLVASEAITLEPCALALELTFWRMSGYLGYTLADWLCIVHHVSDFSIQPPLSKTAEKAYGIFGFSNKYWCSDGVQPSRNYCNISCEKFLDDDIQDDVLCARRVLTRNEGAQTWPQWAEKCRGKDLSSYLKDCKL